MPDERRMSITSSSQLRPEDVSHHTFGSVRRGFDPDEVRAYLESIAVQLRGIAEREDDLLRQVAEAEHRAAHPVLDEATLATAVGSETARVLQSAHEAAAEVAGRAQSEADRLLAGVRQETEEARARTEALATETAEAARAAAEELRERATEQATAELDVARREAEDLLIATRDECRAMVEEAQELRSRVLADLARRRKVLHAQIEQLRAGRERLTETVHDVRQSIESIAEDLFAAEDNARLAAEEAGRAAAARADDDAPEETAAVVITGASTAGGAVQAASGGAGKQAVGVAGVAAPSASGTRGEVGDSAAPSTVEIVEVVEEIDEIEVVETGAGGADEVSVDALFARIRAERQEREATREAEPSPAPKKAEDAVGGDAGTPAPAAGDEAAGAGDPGQDADAGAADASESDEDEVDEPPEERSPAVIRRDELIDPIVSGLARRLKRYLQDSQNELLDRLRSSGAGWSPDLLLDQTEAVDSLATAALPALEEAAEAGVSVVGSDRVQGPRADVLIGIADELADAVVGPLRRRLTSKDEVAESDEAAAIEHVGSAFREWKGERIERLSGDYVVAAFSAGTMAAIEAESGQVEWVAVAGSGEAPCPDCEDNGLNGSQEPGEEFPTGHVRPPAHPGCRCLLSRSAT
jgi:DivIVA domain-containing protein